MIAHKEQLGSKSKATVQPRCADQKKSTLSKPDSSHGHQRSLQCYHCQGFGHRQSYCVTKISPKDQKGWLTLVSQSSQKKTHAMVAQLDEDGQKPCMFFRGAGNQIQDKFEEEWHRRINQQ